jgi:general secretion pathway protein B
MSFILDALKKSELERQRQSVPGLVDSGVARPRPRLPAWAIALGLLLAVNLLVLLFVVMRSFLASPHAQTTTAAPPRNAAAAVGLADPAAGEPAGAESPGTVPPSVAAPAAGSGHFSPLDAPVYAPEVPVASPPPAAAGIPGPDLVKSMNGAGPVSIKAHRRDPLLTDEDYKVNDDELLPTINEVTLTGAQALPDLHLDVHVFATRPAERFVYVNMRKYHEGATLQEGPTIERIRRDGVILSYQGLRFLLPRQ